MTVYFQHVGEQGAKRDFPRTIGTQNSGLVLFDLDEVEEYLKDLPASEVAYIKDVLAEKAPDGFQIWGIPAGAKSVIRRMETGDYLLLLETITEGGFFTYGGEVLAKLSRECGALSRFLWTDARFPLIIFLKGNILRYPWFLFCDEFGFSKNWNPAGNTYRLKDERLQQSQFGGEMSFRRSLREFAVETTP